MFKSLIKLLNVLPYPLRKRLFVGFSLFRRAMTLGVRCVVVDENGRVILVRHTYVDGWHFPGGGVERGETIYHAAAKEVFEEANLTLNGPAQLIHFYRNTKASRFDHVALLLCRSWQGELRSEANWEIAEVGFFPIGELPNGTTAPTKECLKELFGDQPFRDSW